MKLILLLSLVSSSLALLGIGRTQSVAVTGRLICNGQPASNVKVKLYEKESSKYPPAYCITCQPLTGIHSAFDVKMAEGVTNQNGEFRLSGSKTEISTIDPKVNIYHKCNYNGVSTSDFESFPGSSVYLSCSSFATESLESQFRTTM